MVLTHLSAGAKKVGEVLVNTATGVGNFVTGASSKTLTFMSDVTSGVIALPQSVVAEVSKRFEPTPVRVVCRPKKDARDKDDYELEIDMQYVEAKFMDGHMPRPQFEVVATSADINRKKLARRLQHQFDDELQEVQRRVSEAKRIDKQNILIFLRDLIFKHTPNAGRQAFMLLLVRNPAVSSGLMLTGMSRHIEDAIEQSIKLFFLGIQQELFGLDPKQLETETQKSRDEIQKMIAKIDIVIDLNL